ncbi:ABC transporter substrate-binding protein [Leucobacter soli]|uniref:Periplasmic dipeptide transport protein n=1 Tax=Leucobacter soli TaxID=2812850 RepID=A0A916JY89_9MICO|nr:ABC transporter substrate-binding protein [Leucobacter soli]CAG7613387.1 Periplasmic dipeptide transport protein [Leucobacter soli]
MSSTPNPPRVRRTALAALATAAALVLSACAGGADQPSAPTELADSGQEIDSLTVAFPGSLANLYVGQEGGILNYYLAATVQEGLVGIDSAGKFVPALADTWETPDANTYVFHLRDEAKFQNGDPVTPEDVVFSLEQAADPEASPSTSWYLSTLDSAEITGDREITITTTKPDAAFLSTLANVGALVVTQQEFWEEHDGEVGTADSLLLGTGPYQVTEFAPDSHVTLERVDTWWGELPKAKEIRVDFIPDENTRLLAAQKGDIDVAFNVPINQAQQWEKISDGRLEAVNDLSYVGLMFDQEVEPFDDPKVRTAIAQAFDRETVAEKLLRGYGEVATAIMTPESLGQAYDADEARELLAGVPQHAFDLDAAKQLLDESGAGGFTAELTYPNTGPQLGTAAQALAENLKQIGITLTVREIPIEEWLSTIGDGEHGLSFMWYFSTTGDPAEVNSYLVGPENPNQFASDEAAALVDAAGAATDPAERIATLLELETLSAEQTVNAPLWWGKTITYLTNGVGVHDFSPFTFLGPWGAQLYAAEVAE